MFDLLVFRKGDVERLLMVKPPGCFGGDLDEWRGRPFRFRFECDRPNAIVFERIALDKRG